MNSGVRIGINLLAFEPGRSGGAELYARNLVAALARIDRVNEYVLFTNLDNDEAYRSVAPSFCVERIGIRSRPQFRRVLTEQLLLPVLAKRHRLAILHSPSYTWPLAALVPGVVTIPDMLYRSQPHFVEQPKLTFWRIFVPMSAWRCKKVLTISDHARRDIARYLKVPISKIVVTPLAPIPMGAGAAAPGSEEATKILAQYRIAPPYVLTVAGLGKHKNTISLVRALDLLQRRNSLKQLSLVVTGNDYGARDAIWTEIERLGLTHAVVLPGYVPARDLPTLYACAAAYASVSRFEGFGMTVLEAMACGAPVVISNCASLPEVAGDAAVVVDPDDTDALAGALFTLIADPERRRDYVERGRNRVAQFSWDATARLTLDAYLEAGGVSSLAAERDDRRA